MFRQKIKKFNQILLDKTSSFLNNIYKTKSLDKNIKYKIQPPVCKNVKEWCNSQPESVCSTLYKLIRESQVDLRKPPNTIELTVHQKFVKNLKSLVVPEKYLVCIRGAKLVSPNGMLILPDGSYVEEVAFDEKHLVKLPEYRTTVRSKTLKKYGTYYSLLQLFCSNGNYYHWMHDVLQKLYLVIELLPKDIIFLVPNKLTKWQYESLDAIGVNAKKLCSFTGDEVWELDTLYFSPPTTITGNDLPEANKWVQSSLYKRFGLVPSARDRNERIFISRSLAGHRKIVNETEVKLVLQEYGFQTYVLERLSLEEQVNLFAKAEAVVASHGAGLTNLIFAKPGIRVLEIFEPSTIKSLCYWSLCESMNHKYWYFFGSTVKINKSQQNIFVPIKKLIQCLKQMLG